MSRIIPKKSILSAAILGFLFAMPYIALTSADGTDPAWNNWPPLDFVSPYYVELGMRDNIILGTAVYANWDNMWYDENQKTPTLLHRSPYEAVEGSDKGLELANEYGYMVIEQDIRGTGTSWGINSLFGDDWSDGYDTIQWLKGNASNNWENVWWWNGKVGSIGSSADGVNQYCYAGEDIPELTAQIIGYATPEQYDHLMFMGGCLRYNQIMCWTLKEGIDVFLLGQTLINTMEPKKTDFFEKRSLDMGNRYANVHAASLQYGGWFDPFVQGIIDGHVGYNTRGAEDARGHQVLILAPVGHGDGAVGQLEFPNGGEPKALIDEITKFIFEADLEEKYGPRGSASYEAAWADQDKVIYYMCSDPAVEEDPDGNVWRTADAWPVENTPTKFYLVPGADQWNGVLSPSKPTSPASISYLYNPWDPCPSNGGHNIIKETFTKMVADKLAAVTFEELTDLDWDIDWDLPFPTVGRGPTDQRGSGEGTDAIPNILDRSDVISFATPALSQPTEFTGEIKAELYVQSNCSDTDFVGKLIDVFPDGREILVSEGALRACRMNGVDTTMWMEPGNTYKIDMSLWSKAWRFQAGHQIKLLVTSSNYPNIQKNPNLQEEIIGSAILEFNEAYNTIVMSPDYPSYLELPITKPSSEDGEVVPPEEPAEPTVSGFSIVPLMFAVLAGSVISLVVLKKKRLSFN